MHETKLKAFKLISFFFDIYRRVGQSNLNVLQKYHENKKHTKIPKTEENQPLMIGSFCNVYTEYYTSKNNLHIPLNAVLQLT